MVHLALYLGGLHQTHESPSLDERLPEQVEGVAAVDDHYVRCVRAAEAASRCASVQPWTSIYDAYRQRLGRLVQFAEMTPPLQNARRVPSREFVPSAYFSSTRVFSLG